MTRGDLAQLALTQVGKWCYVWGGNGEDMTSMSDSEREAWICKRESDEKNRSRVRTLFDKLKAKAVNLIRGGDCSGFVFWCMKQLGLWKSDMRADGMYKRTTRIDKSELVPGDLGFRVDASTDKATHVGIYVGGGKFVHSRDRDVGVIGEITSAKYWQAFGRIKEFQPEPVPDPDPDPKPDPEPTEAYVNVVGGSVNVRKEADASTKSLCIVHKGDHLPIADGILSVGTDNSRWFHVTVPKGDGYIREFNSKNGHRLCELVGGID